MHASAVTLLALHQPTQTGGAPVQWLDSLPADQLAQLAAMEAAPNGPAAVGASSGGGDATHTAPPAGTKGAVRRNNSSNGSNRA